MKDVIKLLVNFLDIETEDWNDFDYDYYLEEEYKDYFKFRVTLRRRDTECECIIRVYPKTEILMIDMGEDSFQEIDYYTHKVKWFWIKNHAIWNN